MKDIPEQIDELMMRWAPTFTLVCIVLALASLAYSVWLAHTLFDFPS
jgi:hypothetical protein